MTAYHLFHATDPLAYRMIAIAAVLFVVSVWATYRIAYPDRPYLDAAPAFAMLALFSVVGVMASLIMFGMGIGLWIAR